MTSEQNDKINPLGNPDIDVTRVYGSLEEALSTLSEAYSLSRSEAIDCLAVMANAMRDGSNGTDTDDVTTLGARFDWALFEAVEQGEQWAVKTARTLESWDGEGPLA